MDSWEQEANPPVQGLSDKFSGLNVDAPVFVPGQRYNFGGSQAPAEWSSQAAAAEPEPETVPPVGDVETPMEGSNLF